MDILNELQNIKNKVDKNSEKISELKNVSNLGKEKSEKMYQDLQQLKNTTSLTTKFSGNTLNKITDVSSKIKNDLTNQTNKVNSLKNSVDSLKNSVDSDISGILNKTSEIKNITLEQYNNSINKYTELGKKQESDFNQVISNSKKILDENIKNYSDKLNSSKEILNNYSSFDKILNSVGGVDNLKTQLLNVRNKEDLKNVLSNLAPNNDINALVNNIKDLSSAENIKNQLLNFGAEQKSILENSFNASISEIKSDLNNLENIIGSSTSEFQDYANNLINSWSNNSDIKNIITDSKSLISLGINSNINDIINSSNKEIADLLKNNSNLLETISTNSVDFNDIQINSDIISLNNIPETVSSNFKVKKILESNELQPNFSDFSESPITSKIPTETSDFVKNGDTIVASFNGIKLQDDGSDPLESLRTQYFESNGQLNGFIAPWDGRLGPAYTNTQTIGNHMPYGEEWVGSPSIANPYALIRFEQVAGKNHHKSLLDQRGSYDFRSSRVRPVVTLQTLEKENFDFTTQEKDGKTVVVFDGKTAAQLGVTSTDNVLQDESGALYIDEPDTGVEIWKPKKDGITSSGKSVKSPEEVEVIKAQQGNVDTMLRNAEINANLAGDNFDKEKTREEIQSELKNNSGGSDKTVYTPNQAEYWYMKEGWVRCPENGGPFVPINYCEGDKIKSGSVDESGENSEAKALTDELKRVSEIVKIQTSRQWYMDGYASNKRYIKSPNSVPTSLEVIPPSTDALVNAENWKGREQFIYSWSDFLYASNFPTSNHYLITLRRFPVPVNDAGTVPKQDVNHQFILPVARAVTWAGEGTGNKISEILSFQTTINWKDMEADVHSTQGNEQGFDQSPFGTGIAKWLGRIDAVAGGGKFGQVSGWDEERAKFDPYTDGEYAGRIYGPVNVIHKTLMRDRGLDFSHDIKLNFAYSLRSIGGVNPKAALLDIMANFLALTYNNANFWGGANRYFPNKPQYPFLGGERGMKAWYKGDVTGYLDGLADHLTSTLKDFGSMLMGLFTNPAEALKKLATGTTKVWMAEKSKDKRPTIMSFKALLTGEPVGEWHLVIGNPFNPIAMIGNLVVTDVNYSFGGADEWLGPDDFPDTLNISVTLKHGRPRDKGDIESMFNRGAGRLHYSYFGKDEPWNSTQSTKNIAIMKAATTYEDNFDGKTKSVGNKMTMADHSTVGNETGNPRAATASVIGAGSKQAYDLAAKVGFKSGS